MNLDVYSLINSKAIGEYCRKINHKFNLEEMASIIYRCKQIDIEEKINLYKELIKNCEDMPMTKNFHSGPYASMKDDVIKQEIKRLENVSTTLTSEDKDYFFTCGMYYISSGKYEIHCYTGKTYEEILNDIIIEIEEYNDVSEFNIIKQSFSKDHEITAKFILKDKKKIMVNVYDSDNVFPDISYIFLELPNPFKKGDLLYSNSNTPFWTGYIPHINNVFCLDSMVIWEKNFEQKLAEGKYIDSDMRGSGYYIQDNSVILGICADYDNWEYFEGNLTGMERILKGVQSLLKDEIGIHLFLEAYDEMKREQARSCLNWFTDEELKLAGFNYDDIKKLKE